LDRKAQKATLEIPVQQVPKATPETWDLKDLKALKG
jgi:hypothetical protein